MTTETSQNDDTTAILAEPSEVILASGMEVNVQRLRTRQTMRLLRILTKGIGDAITEYRFDPNDTDNFVETMLSLAVLAIPEAEDETIDFIQSMVEPKEFVRNPRTKEQKERNTEVYEQFVRELENPDLDDLITIIEVIFRNEAEYVLSLGKRLAALLEAHQKSETAKSGAKKSRKDAQN